MTAIDDLYVRENGTVGDRVIDEITRKAGLGHLIDDLVVCPTCGSQRMAAFKGEHL